MVALTLLVALIVFFGVVVLLTEYESVIRKKNIPVFSVEAVMVIVAGSFLATLYCFPYFASSFSIPDSVEYVAAAMSFAETGNYAIHLRGEAYIPRYPPWFSIFFLSPIYALLGSVPGIEILLTTVIAALGGLVLAIIALRFISMEAAFFSALFLLFVPEFRYFSQHTLVDIPLLTTFLLLILIYIPLYSFPERRTSFFYVAAGIAVAIAGLLRVTGFVLIAPFLFTPKIFQRNMNSSVLKSYLEFLFPVIIAIFANGYYNYQTFGSFFRSGYNFWMAVPYDFPGLLFSPKYFPEQLTSLLTSTAFWFLSLFSVGTYFICTKIRDEEWFRGLERFFLFGALPLTLLYCFYFHSTARFFLPLYAMLALFAAISAARIFEQAVSKQQFRIVSLAIAIILFSGVEYIKGREMPKNRMMMDRLSLFVSDGSVIISGRNPLLSSLYIPGIEVLPVSRRVEYASKYISPRSLSGMRPTPMSPYDHRNEIVFQAGGIDPYPEVAVENPDYLRGLLSSGKKLYVDFESLNQKERRFFKNRFTLTPVAEGIQAVTE